MNVLVTGCAGYIGSTLVGHLLRAGHHVVGVDNLMYGNGAALLPYLGHPVFEFYRADVRHGWMDWLVSEADAVIPLAAIVGAPRCDRQPRDAEDVNWKAVRRLAVNMRPGQRLLYPNTNSGYGETDGGRMVTEDDPLAPISVYGRTKCAAESAVLHHPNSAVLRLATVFGASPRMRMDLMVNDFAGKVWAEQLTRSTMPGFGSGSRRGPALTVFEPHFKRNFVGVQDVARAFLHLLEHPDLHGVYNLGLPTANLTKLQLAHAVCGALCVDPTSMVAVGEGTDPDRRNYLVSNDKILSTGFTFTHDLTDGVREVAQVVETHGAAQLAAMRNA
jgi:nucleoside-diphosphate-sugar epimerase